jgi:hypothetical protein
LCTGVEVSPSRLNFGSVPITPTAVRIGDRPTFFGTPERVFWDDLGDRVLPYTALENASILLDWFAPEHQTWINAEGVYPINHSPPLVILPKDRPQPWILLDGLDLDPSEVAYFLVEMRAWDTANPHMRLAWLTTDEHEGYRAEQQIYTIGNPDGRFHVYALPLHAHRAWQTSQRIRALRFLPTDAPGSIEIKSMKLIGPIPD